MKWVNQKRALSRFTLTLLIILLIVIIIHVFLRSDVFHNHVHDYDMIILVNQPSWYVFFPCYIFLTHLAFNSVLYGNPAFFGFQLTLYKSVVRENWYLKERFFSEVLRLVSLFYLIQCCSTKISSSFRAYELKSNHIKYPDSVPLSTGM